jgi:hypothetical protein
VFESREKPQTLKDRESALPTLELILAGDAGGHVHFPHLEEPKPRN